MARGSLFTLTDLLCKLCTDLKEWEPCKTFSCGIRGNMRAYPPVCVAMQCACSVSNRRCLERETMKSPHIGRG